MKDWEQAAILTDVLDRHADRLSQTPASDWTIYWTLAPFLKLVTTEPILAALATEYVEEADEINAAIDRQIGEVATRISRALNDHRESLMDLKAGATPGQWMLLALEAYFDPALKEGSPDMLDRAVKVMDGWIQCRRDVSWPPSVQPVLAEVVPLLDRLGRDLEATRLPLERLSHWHAGLAYLRLCQSAFANDYSSGSAAFDEAHNRNVAQLHGRIRDSKFWGARPGDHAQPGIQAVQQDVRALHLALVTSLARGRSRWAVVRRFAARCESFDRDQLLRTIEPRGAGSRRGKPEALLTLAFARYLFDAGFNPLVDTAACGLRPDVLDPTHQPAVYVEAKQYKDVGPTIANALRGDVAQTLNTWGRLAKRWWTPEAFLLIFRRSGRPIKIDRPGITYLGGRLYVMVVDLGAAIESGSRAKEPVHVSLPDLMPKAAQ